MLITSDDFTIQILTFDFLTRVLNTFLPFTIFCTSFMQLAESEIYMAGSWLDMLLLLTFYMYIILSEQDFRQLTSVNRSKSNNRKSATD